MREIRQSGSGGGTVNPAPTSSKSNLVEDIIPDVLLCAIIFENCYNREVAPTASNECLTIKN